MTEPKKKPAKDPKTGRFLPANLGSMKHGAWIYLRSGKLPSVRGRRKIQHHLSELRRRLLDVVPNGEDVRVEALVNQVVKCEGFTLLIEEYLKRTGLLKLSKRGLEAQPVLQTVATFMGLQAKALAALGMSRKDLEPLRMPYDEEEGKP